MQINNRIWLGHTAIEQRRCCVTHIISTIRNELRCVRFSYAHSHILHIIQLLFPRVGEFRAHDDDAAQLENVRAHAKQPLQQQQQQRRRNILNGIHTRVRASCIQHSAAAAAHERRRAQKRASKFMTVARTRTCVHLCL